MTTSTSTGPDGATAPARPSATAPAPTSTPVVDSPAPDCFVRDDLPTADGATGALLRSLLATRRTRVAVAALLLLLQQAAAQTGPLLVAYAIDRGCRPSGTATTARCTRWARGI